MAKKQAVCTNIDCSEYKKVVELETGAEMVCPHCGQPMKAAENVKGGKKSSGGSAKGKGGKLAVIATVAAVVLGGGGALVYNGLSDEPAPVEKPAAPAAVTNSGTVDVEYGKYTGELKNGKPHGQGEIVFSKNYPLPSPASGEALQGETYEGTFADGKPTQLTKIEFSKGEKELEYGKYTGELRNGVPHGKGEIVFTKNYLLPAPDNGEARKGEIYEGEFVKGNPAQLTKVEFSKGEKELEYGKYTGEMRNGIPHGQGKITFSRNYSLPSSNGGEARKGETYEGSFAYGEPVQLTKVKTKASSAGAASGQVRLPYGTYVGSLRNGKPHGHGKVTFTRSFTLSSSQGYVASPGDVYEGDFRDGRPAGCFGYWYHDGNQTAIKL